MRDGSTTTFGKVFLSAKGDRILRWSSNCHSRLVRDMEIICAEKDPAVSRKMSRGCYFETYPIATSRFANVASRSEGFPYPPPPAVRKVIVSPGFTNR